jgi:hypothetical protein
MTAATLKPIAAALAIENSAIHMGSNLLKKRLRRAAVYRHLEKPEENAAHRQGFQRVFLMVQQWFKPGIESE